MLGEKVECAVVSPHLYILSYMLVQCCTPLLQLHSDLRDVSNEVCRVMKTTADIRLVI